MIVTWEVLQGFMHVVAMFAVGIGNVWGTINNLVTQALQLQVLQSSVTHREKSNSVCFTSASCLVHTLWEV